MLVLVGDSRFESERAVNYDVARSIGISYLRQAIFEVIGNE